MLGADSTSARSLETILAFWTGGVRGEDAERDGEAMLSVSLAHLLAFSRLYLYMSRFAEISRRDIFVLIPSE